MYFEVIDEGFIRIRIIMLCIRIFYSAMTKPILMIAAGVALGFLLSTTSALRVRGVASRITNGDSWITVEGMGSKDADPLLKALVARRGIFANAKDKTVYFNGYIDSPIKRFKGGRHYQITGQTGIPAAWWSITLYDADFFLFDNADHRYSFTDFNVKADESGHFVIDVAAERPQNATNWLPSPRAGSIALLLRVYEPTPTLYENLGSYPLPRITEVK